MPRIERSIPKDPSWSNENHYRWHYTHWFILLPGELICRESTADENS